MAETRTSGERGFTLVEALGAVLVSTAALSSLSIPGDGFQFQTIGEVSFTPVLTANPG